MTLAELNQAVADGTINPNDVTTEMIDNLEVDWEAMRERIRNTCGECHGSKTVWRNVPEVRVTRGIEGRLVGTWFTGELVRKRVDCPECRGTGRIASIPYLTAVAS